MPVCISAFTYTYMHTNTHTHIPLSYIHTYNKQTTTKRAIFHNFNDANKVHLKRQVFARQNYLKP